jgi:GNAT superfamily N-acetyltransferase
VAVIRTVSYDHPDATMLIELVQQEYVVRYGGRDDSPVDPAQFAPPRGLFLVAYLDDAPVACGGWRVASADEVNLLAGDIEIKRMFVTKPARGRGLARAVLAELERTAFDAGGKRMVLESGLEQPEALALYASSGYTDIEPFGYYRCAPESVHMGKVLSEDLWRSTPSAT